MAEKLSAKDGTNIETSKQLSDFYNTKISELESEISSLTNKFKVQLQNLEYQRQLEHEFQKQSNEMIRLNAYLSEMQIILYEERELVLKLYNEKDQLQTKMREDRYKILNLLQSGYCDCRKNSNNLECAEEINDDVELHLKQENEVLRLKWKAAEEQLKNCTELAAKEIESLIVDRKVCRKEIRIEHLRNSKKIFSLTKCVKELQELLIQSTEDLFELKSKMRLKEEEWMKQKNEYENRIKQRVVKPCKSHTSNENQQKAVLKGNMLNKKLEKSDNELKIYRQKYTQMDQRLKAAEMQKDKAELALKMQTEKFKQALDLSHKKYNVLERRRNLESEGFQADINNFKTQLKSLEKMLFKVLHTDDNEVDILQKVSSDSYKTNEIGSGLNTLRKRLYQLENNFYGHNG